MTSNRPHWVDVLKHSLPDHAEDLKVSLDEVKASCLPSIDANACALAAALASGNGELAYEILMSAELIHNPIREDVCAIVPYATRRACIRGYLTVAQQHAYNIVLSSPWQRKAATQAQECMYHLATCVVRGDIDGIKYERLRLLNDHKISEDQITSIVSIAATVACVRTVAP